MIFDGILVEKLDKTLLLRRILVFYLIFQPKSHQISSQNSKLSTISLNLGTLNQIISLFYLILTFLKSL